MSLHRTINTLLVCLGLNCFTSSAYAQEEALAEIAKAVAKEAATQVVNFALGEIYDSSCSTPKRPRNLSGLEGFVCNSLASVTGRKEEQFKQELRDGMVAIKKVVDKIEQDIQGLEKGQISIIRALERVEAKVEAVPLETAAQLAVLSIRSTWRDHFLPVSNGTVTRTPEQMLELARDIVFTTRIDQKLGDLLTAMTEQGVGNTPSILNQQMNVILLGLKGAKSDDLQLPYNLYQNTVSSALMEYRKGEMMYAWAAKMLEAQCMVLQEQGEKCRPLITSADDMSKLSLVHRTKILDLYRDNVERLVLAYSSPSSLNSNFLHVDAIRILIATDFYLALNLPSRRGIRGRVISAGKAFSGELTINNKKVPVKQAPRAIASTSDVDWWTRPVPKNRYQKVYDKIHFAPSWSIYDVALDASKLGSGVLKINSPLPWHSGPFQLQKFDMETGELATAKTPKERVIPFGTFTAIARAGGAYAVMQNSWPGPGGAAGWDNYGTGSQPAVIAYDSGSVVLNKDKTLNRKQSLYRSSDVTLVDGGDVTMHVEFRDVADAYRARFNGKSMQGSIGTDTAIYYNINFRKVVGFKSSSIGLYTSVNFSHDAGNPAVSWRHENTNITDYYSGSVKHSDEERYKNKLYTTKGTFRPGTKLRLHIDASYEGLIRSTGLDATPYTIFAGVAPKAIYFTRN